MPSEAEARAEAERLWPIVPNDDPSDVEWQMRSYRNSAAIQIDREAARRNFMRGFRYAVGEGGEQQ